MKSVNQKPNTRRAGADVGSDTSFVSIGGASPRQFGMCQPDLHQIRDWLVAEGVTSVAMEATGVYWICLYDVLEAAGLEVLVVNGQHIKQVAGRKSDVSDAQWIAQLHSDGYLKGGFLPPDFCRELRDYLRHRETLVESAAQCVQRMQKSLELLNLKIHRVINDLQGVSGMALLRAIVAGERDPTRLLALCDPQILRRKSQRLQAALASNWQSQHLFTLAEHLAHYDFCQLQLSRVDTQIHRVLESVRSQREKVHPWAGPVEPATKELRHNAPDIPNLHELTVRIFGGKDLSRLPGLNEYTALRLMAELGVDVNKFPTPKHFVSYLGLSPASAQSGQRRRKVRKHGARAGQILREAAQSMARAKNSWLGSFYRRLSALRCPAIANKATARKLAEMIFNLLKRGHA